MTFEKAQSEILDDLLAQIPDTYQKTIGYPVYDLLKSSSYTVENLYSEIENAHKLTDVDNLEGEDLEKWVYQRKGSIRRAGTYSTGILTVYGTSFVITDGDIFESDGGVQFKATETVTGTGSATVNIECLSIGTVGNLLENTIKFMPVTISGVSSVLNSAPTTGGYEVETDDSLRERYKEALTMPATSGNKYHYIKWAKEVSGVQGVKVFPLEYGDNTVEVVIFDANYEPAAQSLIDTVQEYIDPESSGTGEGEAPIGAYCTVSSASALDIDIEFTVVLVDGYTVEGIQEDIENNIKAYLNSICFISDYVSYAKIGNAILSTDGVVDYSELTVNELQANIAIGSKEIPVLNSVLISEAT